MAYNDDNPKYVAFKKTFINYLPVGYQHHIVMAIKESDEYGLPKAIIDAAFAMYEAGQQEGYTQAVKELEEAGDLS